MRRIQVIGDNSVVESQFADTTPIAEGARLQERGASRGTLVGHFDTEGECAFRCDVALVENLRHDFITKIQSFSFNSGLFCRDQKAHKLGTSRGFVRWLSKLCDLVELAMRRLVINALKNNTCDQQNWHPAAPTPGMDIRSVAKLRIVYKVSVFSGDVLLGNETGAT